MSKIRLEIRTGLSEALGAKGSAPVVLEPEISRGATLGDVLRKLAAGNKALAEVLFDVGTNELSSYVGIVVNGRFLQSLHGLDTTVKDGDNITLLPFVDGG